MSKSVASRSISRVECDRIIARIHAACEREGLAATIAIVDAGGNLKALSRSDEAFNPWAVQVATGKAATALNTGKSTRDLWEAIKDDPILRVNVPTLPDLVVLPGGLPIYDGDHLIGGLGVGGTALYPEDELLAAAGLAED